MGKGPLFDTCTLAPAHAEDSPFMSGTDVTTSRHHRAMFTHAARSGRFFTPATRFGAMPFAASVSSASLYCTPIL